MLNYGSEFQLDSAIRKRKSGNKYLNSQSSKKRIKDEIE